MKKSAKPQEKSTLNSIPFHQLKELLINRGLPPFRAKQVFEWMHQKSVTDFAAMTNLSKADRELLSTNFKLDVAKIEKKLYGKDQTIKYLVQFADGKVAECVYMPDAEGDRATLCVSTQAGCPLGCLFCATGRGGFHRNLTAGEICQQVEAAIKDYQTSHPDDKENPLSNLVFMGMGEPFLNYDNVLDALDILLDQSGLNFSARKITVSTAGIPDKILAFTKWDKQVRLAWSLNAPNDVLRSELMPINQKFPIKVVLTALQKYAHETGRRITIEYILLKGLNDSKDMLDQLSIIAKKVDCNVNLIVYNSTPASPFVSPTEAEVDQAYKYLREKDLLVTVRRSRGIDIQAACGQLAGKL